MWTQAELARRCDVSTKTIRRWLDDLTLAGMPLERQEDHPHVYWSIPPSWFPGGTILDDASSALVARLIARLPGAAEREHALRALLGAREPPNAPGNARRDQTRDGILTTLEDGAHRRRPVRLRYFSLRRDTVDDRFASVHRIVYGDVARLVATCHVSNAIKWFRVDRVEAASVADDETFREASLETLDDFLATSLGGFRQGEAVDVTFTVRHPTARWVVRNLPQPMSVEYRDDGISISARTAALDVLARFVVGLGDAARAETPELRDRVLALAQGAARANTAIRKVNTRSVALKRRSG